MAELKMDFATMSALYRQALIDDAKKHAAMPKRYAPGQGVEEPLLDPVSPKAGTVPTEGPKDVPEGLERATEGSVRLAKNGSFYEAQADGSWKRLDWFP